LKFCSSFKNGEILNFFGFLKNIRKIDKNVKTSTNRTKKSRPEIWADTLILSGMGLEGMRGIETVNGPAHLFDREDKLVRPEAQTPRRAAYRSSHGRDYRGGK
jgi:hypothetical protein